ncbi:MAG: pyridoxal 5'-phosphate synthase glutaminase subunit PdxT [Pelosinus sp.]|nr:pyridoxal 5'-phosphate synthase glutaminase subunit PdxT [Pelosinus sp.]
MVNIGVLALQGAVQEHLDSLQALPEVNAIPIKKAAELENIDGLILPGGESTTIGKLLNKYEITPVLIEKIHAGFPVWGTCAGMILLAKHIAGEEDAHLGVMDITVRRNAYGSQLDSFVAEIMLPVVNSAPIPLVFIRAPYVEQAANNVTVLAELSGHIIAVEQNNLLATSFHPELTKDISFHRYFVKKVKQAYYA